MRRKPFTVADCLRDSKEWYETERNTAALIKAVVTSRELKKFSGDDLWNLLRLTWITKADDDPWKRLKIPALRQIFRRKPVPLDELHTTIRALHLPSQVEKAATENTGTVNFRNVWRNSSRAWCMSNREQVIEIFYRASQLLPDDQTRFSLAREIDDMIGVPSPNRKGNVGQLRF